MKILKLKDHTYIRGKAFYSLMDYCFSRCNHFSLHENVFFKGFKYRNFRRQLRPHLVKKVTLDSWFGYPYVKSKTVPIVEFIYECTPQAKEIIKRTFSCIYFKTPYSRRGKKKVLSEKSAKIFLQVANWSWEAVEALREDIIESGKRTKMPDDICFFADGNLLLGVIAHANVCYAFPRNHKEMQIFHEYGEWELIELDESLFNIEKLLEK